MDAVRIALANVRPGASPQDALSVATEAIADAGRQAAGIICFPEAYLPGYRIGSFVPPPPDADFLEDAWAKITDAARQSHVAVILGTERPAEDGLRITALVVNSDGQVLGFQDKVQLDPSEDDIYSPGSGRRVFACGPLKLGVVICHEGWRYPEAVRAAARAGAQIVFHPHFHEHEPGAYIPATFGDPANTFHEKAVLCRAAENTCYFASVNAALPNSPTTSAIARPNGTLLAWQPYGKEGLLVADIDLSQATGRLARRLRQDC